MARLARSKVDTVSSQSIGSFTRLTKSHAAQDASVKKAVTSEPVSLRKRKAASLDEDEGHRSLARRNVSFPPSSDDEATTIAVQTKRPCRRQQPVAPSTKTVKAVTKGKRVAKAVPSITETAHRPSESTIVSTSKRQGKTIQSKIDFTPKTGKKASANATPSCDSDSSFPPHLADLVNLHKAFLATMRLQFAHHGDSVPLDIQSIAPHISRAWGKRQVTTDDIRRCIAIQSSSSISETASPFIVSDYGRGKVCVELREGGGAASINEDQLCKQFENNLRALCAENAMNEMSDVDISFGSLSLADLPQVAITTMGSSIKMHPAFAKGQRALSELKSDMAMKQQEKVTKQAPSNPLLNPDGSKMSLLDRIRYKQLAKAGEPLPPSGPELQRRAALNRVADVAATISMLSLSSSVSLPRQAFTMAAITEKLKDSLRVPLSKEEGMACVRLIASEIAPEWLRIVTVGGRENVVVQRNSQPVDRIIHERVQKMLS